ncbi:MAG: tetratricopeptide repeat protein [Steroidobacter sp.]
MTDSRKPSLFEILHEAQTMPPGEQLSYVRKACSDDEALYSRAVSELQSRQLWPEIDPNEPDEGRDAPQATVAGERIGPYRIVRTLGAGGMGEVFLAERADDQFRQQVAIKLVRRGLLSRHVQGRLRQERQILASLDHPNIARLYDGGATPDGTPYIVMEYIDGEPIDVYCDTLRLTIEERLGLFVKVCSAVHRAHQNLIVHRDLKPSNILVNGEGVPKLLDFGIAKLLDDRQMMHTLAVTQADVRVMTPDHASPEQIRGDLISTASDIYVLGVLLYELLCGYKPFTPRGNRLAELERAICEDTAPAPSAAVAAAMQSAPGEVAAIADQRSVSAAKLRRELRGDLDNIVAMATRKEPERRYASVEQLAADVGSHLRGLPVDARADAWTYRTGKFVRRHAVVVALSIASVALLIVFSATTYMQSQRIAFERDVAQVQRTRAEAERERAEAVSTFLIDSFRLADPSQARGDTITAREILDRGATRISTELRSQPDLQATLLDTIGSVYLSLGLPTQAQPLVEQGLSIRRALAKDSVDVARSLYSLNRVFEKKGDFQTAETLAHQSLDMNRRLTGENSLETAESVCRLGVIKQEKGELSEAGTLFNRCLQIRRSQLGPDHALLTIPLDNLARIAQDRSDYATAEKLVRAALTIDRQSRGEDHPQYIRHLFHLASITEDRGNAPEAYSLYRQSLKLYAHVLGPEHPETIDAMSAMGLFLMSSDDLDRAQQILEDVLKTNERIRGPRHAYVGNDLENLGRLALRRGQFTQAEQRFNEALGIYDEALPPGHGLIAAAWTMLGRTRLAQGRAKEAEAAFTEALNAWRIEYGEKSIGYAVADALRGRAWILQSRFTEAERVLTQTYPKFASSSRNEDREMAADMHGWIETVYQKLGRPEAAVEYFAKIETADK